jgi:hypothetical protein
MNIPKIAISNEDDSSLKIVEMRSTKITNTSNSSSPYKSIIKNRSSQPPTPSSTSTTTQTYYTAPTRMDSNDLNRKSSIKDKSNDQLQIKKQIIDENDTENDVSELSQLEDASKLVTLTTEQKIPRRRDTISTTSILNSNENIPKRQFSLRENRSFKNANNDNSSTSISYNSSRNYFIPHVSTPPPPLPYAEESIRNSLTQTGYEQRQNKSNPVRRTNSYRPSSSSSTSRRRSITRNGKLIEQETNYSHQIIKRRSTFDNSSYPMTQIETSSIYETPKYEENEQYIQSNINNSIQLVIDTNLNTQSIVNNESDMQLDITKLNQQSTGVSQNN